MGQLGNLAVDVMKVFVMSTKIATLCESFIAQIALERPCRRMLAEMIPQVTAFAKKRATVLVLAAEVKLQTLGLLVTNLYDLVPLRRNSLKFFYKWRRPRILEQVFKLAGVLRRNFFLIMVGVSLNFFQARQSALKPWTEDHLADLIKVAGLQCGRLRYDWEWFGDEL